MAPDPLVVRKLADTSVGERHTRYSFRAQDLVFSDDGTTAMIDPDLCARILYNPDTEGIEHEPWPFAGLSIEGDPPAETRVSQRWVIDGRNQGWLTVEGERVQYEPGGPQHDPTKVTHAFVEADAIVLHTVDGDVRYEVTHQPGKYTDADEDSGYRVDWYYDLRLAG